MRLRRPVVLAAVAFTAAATTLATAANAGASAPLLTPGASAQSAAAYVNTAALSATLKLTGSLGKLVDPVISPILSQDVQPLLNALNGTVKSLLGLTGLSANTDSGDSQVGTAAPAWPNNTIPSPCASGAHCYTAASVAGSVSSLYSAGLVSTNLGTSTGYVEQVQAAADTTNPILARATALSLNLSALQAAGLPTSPAITASTIKSAANCPNDGAAGASAPNTTPTANNQAAGVNVLNGLITFDSGSGYQTQLSDGSYVSSLDSWPTHLVVNNVAYPDTKDKKGNTVPGVLSLTKTVVNGMTISRFGQGIQVAIPLTVDQLLKALGLPSAIVTALEGFTPKSSVTLTLTLTSQSTVTTTSATAWGLGVGVDLSGSLSFNLLGLVTAAITIPTGIATSTNGDLLDLRLGYSTCRSGINSGTPTATPAIPPALV